MSDDKEREHCEHAVRVAGVASTYIYDHVDLLMRERATAREEGRAREQSRRFAELQDDDSRYTALARRYEALREEAREVCELEPDLKILSRLRKLARGKR